MAEAKGWSPEERAMQLEDAHCIFQNLEAVPKESDEISLSVETVHDLHSLFKLLDADDNGYIDFEEILKAANQLGFPLRVRKPRTKHLSCWIQLETAA